MKVYKEYTTEFGVLQYCKTARKTFYWRVLRLDKRRIISKSSEDYINFKDCISSVGITGNTLNAVQF